MPTFEEIAAYNRKQYMKEVERQRKAELAAPAVKQGKKTNKPDKQEVPEMKL